MLASTQARRAILNDALVPLLNRLDLYDLHGKRIFITGGTGFFGLWILSALRVMYDQGLKFEVCVLSRDPSAFLTLHSQFEDASWLRWITGNIRDLEPAHGTFDLLIHAATETSLAAHSNTARMFDDIVLGTRRVLTLAKVSGVRRVLLISSGAVYGPQPVGLLHQNEDSALACNPLLPGSAYGEGKRVMELLGSICQQTSTVKVVIARCYAFSGAGLPLNGHFAIGNFVHDALYNTEIIVKGDGSAMRSYLDGADLAIWLLKLLLSGEAGQAYHVGSDDPISIYALAVRVRDLLAPAKPVRVMRQPDPATTVSACYVPAISRARALGCEPWTNLESSVQRMADYSESSV